MNIRSMIAMALFFSMYAYPQASFADGQRIPAELGRLATVESIRVQPHADKNASEIIATVKYNAICTPPRTFIVVAEPNFRFTVVESETPRIPGTLTCQAISYETEEIHVGWFYGPTPESISVNGIGLKQ